MPSIRRWLARVVAPPFNQLAGHTIYVGSMPPQPFLVDVGANRGAFTRAFCDRFGGQSVLVEPNPALVSQLEAALPFRTLPYAVATVDGPVTFNVAKNDEGSSLLLLPNESPYDCTLDHSETVEGRTLDTLLDEIGEPRVDVLKMDAEGIELLILPRITESAARRIAQLTVELHCDPVFGFGRQDMARDVRRRLRTLGFVDFDFSAGSIESEDLLFVNRRFYDVSPLTWWRWQRLTQLRRFSRRVRRLARRRPAAVDAR